MENKRFNLYSKTIKEIPLDKEMAETNLEISKVLKEQQERFTLNTDSEFWCSIYFKTRDQKEAFLKALNVDLRIEDKYIDGNNLAKRMKIKLPDNLEFREPKIKKDYSDLSS